MVRPTRPGARDVATFAVVAAVVLVGVATLGAGAVYVTVQTIKPPAEAPSHVVFGEARGCPAALTVRGASPGLPYAELRIVPRPEDAALGPWLVAFGGRVAHSTAWEGDPDGGVVAAGDDLVIWAASPERRLTLIHAASQSIVGELSPVSIADDARPVVAFAMEGTTVRGTVSDEGCSGLAGLALQVTDATTGLVFDGGGFGPGPAADVPVPLDDPGRAQSSWTFDLATLPVDPTHTFVVTAVATDGAGMTNATSTPPAGPPPAEAPAPPPEPPAPPEEPPQAPPPAPPAFTILPGGGIRAECAGPVTLDIVGVDITYGPGGPKIPVKVSLTRNGGATLSPLFAGKAVAGGMTTTLANVVPGEVLGVYGSAKYATFFAAYYSYTADPHVVVLEDGDPVPTVPAFDQQTSIDVYLRPYVDVPSQTMSLAKDEVIVLYEFNKALNVAAADYQDLVLKLAFAC